MTTTSVPDRLGNDIIRVSSSEWFVRSRKHSPGSYWRVQVARGDEPICGCPAGRGTVPDNKSRYAKACHHVRVAVDFEIKRDRMIHPPRPTAAPAVSALVD